MSEINIRCEEERKEKKATGKEVKKRERNEVWGRKFTEIKA